MTYLERRTPLLFLPSGDPSPSDSASYQLVIPLQFTLQPLSLLSSSRQSYCHLGIPYLHLQSQIMTVVWPLAFLTFDLFLCTLDRLIFFFFAGTPLLFVTNLLKNSQQLSICVKRMQSKVFNWIFKVLSELVPVYPSKPYCSSLS